MAQLKSTKVFGDLNVTGEINTSTKITVNGEEVWDTGNFNPDLKANTSTQVIAGTGLSGGGDLSANRTLSVSYGTTAGTAAQGNDSRLSNSREWTASLVSQAEAEAGTSTTARKWTAQRVRQAILGWWNTSASKTKLDGIETGATKNATDAQLRSRATHTGTQPISSVTNLQSSLDGKVDKQTGYGLSQENYTPAEKSKLASLEGSKFKGEYTSLAALNAAQPSPEVGSYAYVDAGVGEVVSKYIWDSSDAVWAKQQGETASLTPAEIKSLYEENPDTNAFTDSEKTKLSGIQAGATANATNAQLRDRATHTGVQPISSVSGLQAGLDSKADTTYVNTQLDGKVDKTTSVVAGTGLSGGGTLSTDRTLNVQYGTTAGTAAQGNDSRLSNSREWTATTVSQAEAEAGTATTRRAWTAQRVRQSILAWWTGSDDKAKLDGIETGAQVNTVTSVAGKTGAVTVTKADVGLSNVNNTSDANKPVSTAQQAALDLKADTTTQVIAGTGLTGGGTLAANRTLSVSYGTTAGTAAQGNDSRLSNSREWTATVVTQAEAEAGTATTARKWTSQRVRQAILGWWNGSSDKTKLDGIESGAQVNSVTSVAGKTGAVTLTHTDVNAAPTSHTHPLSQITGAGNLASLSTNASTSNFLRGDGTWATPPNTNTTYSEITTAEIDAGTASTLRTITGRRMKYALDKKADVSHTHTLSQITDAGNVAGISTNGSSANFLRGDGTWVTPPNTNTTYTEITTAEIDAGTASTLRTITGRRMKYALDKKSDTGHGHAIGDITGLQTALDSKANASTQVIAGTGLSGGGTLEANRTLSVNYGTTAGTAAQGNDSRLSNSREWTASVVSQAEAEAGTATTARKWTAQRVSQAISALGLKIGTTASTAKAGNWTPTWPEVSGKPTTFTPASHTHTLAQITDAGNLAALNTNASTANFLRGDGTWVTPPNTNTVTSVRANNTGTYRTGNINLIGGSNVTVSEGTTGQFTISATNTNTTYSAGDGLTLSGTTFSLPVTVSGSGSYVQSVTQSTNGLTVTLGTPPNTNTTYSEITTAEIDAGTASTLRTITGRRMKYALDKKADASHTHPWSQVTGQPATATRWPTFAEVTGKPTNYATTWDSVASKPAQATRWPSWSEVSSKPSTFAPSSHTHPASQVTGLGSAAFSDSTAFLGATAVSVGIASPDTRAVISLPKNIPSKTLTAEFKSVSSVGNPPTSVSARYAHILNFSGYSSSEGSGGWPSQISVGDGLAVRVGTGLETWGPWRNIYHTGNMPTTATRWPTWAEVTGKPTNYATTWDSVASKPATATRWPTFAEVTGKPTNYATTWDSVASKPATATRWPTWSEVTSKPSVATQANVLGGNATNYVTGSSYVNTIAWNTTSHSSGTVTLNLNTSLNHILNITGSVTIGAPSNATLGKTGDIVLRVNAAVVVSWATQWKFLGSVPDIGANGEVWVVSYKVLSSTEVIASAAKVV